MHRRSDWTYFVDKDGHTRFKHKGSGLIRDSLMAVGTALKKGATEALRSSAQKAGKRIAEKVVEKGSARIRSALRPRAPPAEKGSARIRSALRPRAPPAEKGSARIRRPRAPFS